MEPIVLEDWLRAASSPVSSASSALVPPSVQPASPEFAASAIVHAWAQIRVYVQQQKVLTSSDSEAFDLLHRHRRSLHLADSQAKLLQALLTEVSSSDAAFLGFVRRFAVLGLLAWIRKSFTRTGTNSGAAMKQPAPETLGSLVQSIRRAMEERPLSDLYTGEVILLLGTISSLVFVSAAVRRDCLTTIAVELEERRDVICRGAIAEALAGAGHALAVSSDEHLVRIFRALLLLWTPRPDSYRGPEVAEQQRGLGVELDSRQVKEGQDGTLLKDVVMLLHLMDYLGTIFLAREASQTASSTSQVELMHEAVLRVLESDRSSQCIIHCSSIMAAVGLLRSLYRWNQGKKKGGISAPVDHKWRAISGNLENLVVKICERTVTPDVTVSSKFPVGPLPAAAGVSLQVGNQRLCRYVGVAVSRCRGLPAHPHILRCLLLCIFSDALHLDTLYPVLTAELATGGIGINEQQQQEKKILPSGAPSDLGSTLDEFQVHIDSFFFQELGAIARAMCDQYRWTRGDLRGQTERLVSKYARNLYEKHRLLVALSGNSQRPEWTQYRQTLEKVLETAFITVVIFFSLSVREHVPDNNETSEAERAALSLDSLSCVEYFRHIQLREFSRVIQLSVSQIAGSEAASVCLARLLPAYQDITQGPGTSYLNQSYNWYQDEVQTARILFYFRVMPLCLIKMPEATFAAEMAPPMFLYLQHPSETVTKASHALFAAFLSLGVRSTFLVELEAKNSQKFTAPGPETKSAIMLREQLVVFYIQRALQGFPGVTPFQGLVAGVGAIARQLPPGSSATVYCLNCLVDKAVTLYNTKFDPNDVRTPEGRQPGESIDQLRNFSVEEIGAAQKLQILLLHLILLVDLQVLPILLKLMAKLILGLPQHFQITALAEAFDVVGGSDDYTRKPIVVPWLQSLSYLLFNIQHSPNNRQLNSKEDSSSDTTRSVNVSSPEETVTKSKAVEVKSSEHVAQETTEGAKQVSNLETAAAASKTVTPKAKYSREIAEERLENENKEYTNEHERGDLEPRSKL